MGFNGYFVGYYISVGWGFKFGIFAFRARALLFICFAPLHGAVFVTPWGIMVVFSGSLWWHLFYSVWVFGSFVLSHTLRGYLFRLRNDTVIFCNP